MEDRFKIKRKKEFKIPKHISQNLFFLLLVVIYILFLFFTSQNGVTLSNGTDVYPLSFKIGLIDEKIIYSTSKSLYYLNNDKYLTFQSFVRDFKVDTDRIYLLSENILVLNKDLRIIREIKKEGFYPVEIFLFENKFAIKYYKKDSLTIQFSLFDKKDFRELKKIKFENLSGIPFSTVFLNSEEKIVLFQNDGDLLIVNFDGEILIQKNIRPRNEILFNPKGMIDNDNKEMIFYWHSYSYLTNSLLFLNFDGDIKIKFNIKSDINDVLKIEDKYYLLLNDKILVIENEKVKNMISIPFLKPTKIMNLNGNLASVWEFKNYNSNYKILKIENKCYLFRGKFKDILYSQNKIYILIDSKLYITDYE